MLINKSGFSLVELIIVIVILGILLGIGVPSLIGYVQKAKNGVDQINAGQILRVITITYATDHIQDADCSNAIKEAKILLEGEVWPVPKTGETAFSVKMNGSGESAQFEILKGSKLLAATDTSSVAGGISKFTNVTAIPLTND